MQHQPTVGPPQDPMGAGAMTPVSPFQALPMQPSFGAQPPYIDPAGAISLMFNQLSSTLTQVQQGQARLGTDMAVLATDVRNINQHMQSIERGFDTRVKDLEAARLTEASQMGGLRADFATQLAQAMIAAQSAASNAEQRGQQQHATHLSAMSQALISAAIPAFVSLIGIIVTLLIVISQIHH